MPSLSLICSVSALHESLPAFGLSMLLDCADMLNTWKMPIVMSDGVTDWMDKRHTLPLLAAQAERAAAASAAGGAAAAGGPPPMVVYTVANAGHQLFLDNVHGAVEAVIAAATAPVGLPGGGGRRPWFFDGLSGGEPTPVRCTTLEI